MSRIGRTHDHIETLLLPNLKPLFVARAVPLDFRSIRIGGAADRYHSRMLPNACLRLYQAAKILDLLRIVGWLCLVTLNAPQAKC